MEYAAYTDGITNGGDGLGTGLVHYTRQAAERLGDTMFEAGIRAAISSGESVPQKPLDVSATFDGTTLAARWSPPLCRWTGFVVQSSVDGSPWTTAARVVPCDLRESLADLSGHTIRVRVATTNGDLTTDFTAPVEATHV